MIPRTTLLLLAVWLAVGPSGLAAIVNARNGITITSATAINGKTPNAALNGIALASAAGPIALLGFNPIAIPDTAWEQTAIYEPSVIYDGGVFKMWYNGGWANPAIGYATSTDGSVWTKNSSPVIGQGGSSISGTACRNSIIKDGSNYYCYYADATGPNANLKRATSTDGTTWGSVTTVLAYNVLGGVAGWANSSVWKEGATWYMLLESNHGSAPFWKIYLLTSADGTSWSFMNSSNPLTSLQVSSGGMWGGPCMAGKVGATYHLYYHASATVGSALPTDIYHATSTDLINWTITGSPTPILAHTGLDFEGDQVADPCVIEVSGRVYMFYDGDDNPASSASLGLAVFDGTLAGGGTFARIAAPDYTNPIEVWEMHETSGNRAGAINSLTLTDNGGVGNTTGPGSKVAAVVNGSKSLSRASEALIQLGNFNFAFAGWINVSDSSGATAAPLGSKLVSGNNQFLAYSAGVDGWRAVFYSNGAGSTYHTDFEDVYSSGGTPPNNTWQYICFYHNADTNKIGISINGGTPVETSWAKGVWPQGAAPLLFGSYGGSVSADRRMMGWAYWHRVPTQAELIAIYNAGAGKDYPY